ncbi:MAG TPA: FMN-binding protein [Clostridia bacterium]|nr:FMN-binding protein [Clostridia bacterium]
MNRKKVIILAAAIVLLAGLAYGVNYLINLSYYNKVMPTVTIDSVDVSKLEDGIYSGSFDARIIAATTEVTVKDGRITKIDLVKHKYERGKPAIAVVDRIISDQSLDVDVVSGATNSSKAILKAVENALKSGPEKK